MLNLDPGKILIVLTVALIVLGPDKLPGAMKQFGKYWNEFQRVRTRIQGEMNGALSSITDAVGPLTGAVDLGLSQIKGPLGMAASTLLGGSSPNSEAIMPSAVKVESPIPKAINPSNPPEQYRLGEYMEPWSAVEGVAHPALQADPYLN